MIHDAHAIFQAAIRSVQPDQLCQALVLDALLDRPLASYRRVVVVGAGKASMALAGAVEPMLGDQLTQGLVVVPQGYGATLPSSQRAPGVIEVVEAGHPVPNAAGVRTAERTLALAEACTRDDLLLVLLSGGGSSLWPAVARGLSLPAFQSTVRLLLHSGATIHEINAVRKHLSDIGGGYLAARAFPTTVLTLVISDVVGDDLSVIASGPTVPDPSTYADALSVLHHDGVWQQVPASVRDHLEQGQRGDLPETPKPGDERLRTARTHLLAGNAVALEAARRAAEQGGYEARIVSRSLTGEAREVGRTIAKQALHTRSEHPVCLLWGGETTVTVTGAGRGGRNQEVALAAALVLEETDRDIIVLSGGTDGIDGPTDAAGAWATPHTTHVARAHSLDPLVSLANNDAYPFFHQCSSLLKTGPTHTNVMDVLIVLVTPG